MGNDRENNSITGRIIKVITNSDATYSAIYSIIDKIRITRLNRKKTRLIQIATKTPHKITTIKVQNHPSKLIQYLYDKENFIADGRFFISRISLERDLEIIRKRTPDYILNSRKMVDILSLYNDLMINFQKRIIMFSYNKH